MANRTGLIPAILVGGLLGGAIDISYAIVTSNMNGMAPDALLRVIAAGLLGRDVIANGGIAESALGGVLHFSIALVMAAVFCLVSLAIPALRRWWPVTGLAYGAALYAAMNFVVLPLSALAVTPHREGWVLIGELASHMVGVGLSIAGAARWFLGRG